MTNLKYFELGIFRQFCDLINNYPRQTCSLPLSLVMGIVNDRFNGLVPAAHPVSHRPFRATAEQIQAGISGNFPVFEIPLMSQPFLWCCLMGIADGNPDDDEPVQCVLQLHAVNSLLCNSVDITAQSTDKMQDYLFSFGLSISPVFNVLTLHPSAIE